MTEPTVNRPTPARRGKARPVAVSGSKLATHLDCSRQYTSKLTDDGVLQRLPDGRFALDASRVAYLRYLRRMQRRSPKSQADSAFTDAKTRLLQLRIQEREGRLIALDEALEGMEALVGMFRSHLSALPARCSRDLPTRRAIENAVYEILNELADEADRRARECSAVRDGAASSRNGTLDGDGEDNLS